MRLLRLTSLLLALASSFSLTALAAPVSIAPPASQVAVEQRSERLDINSADATALQRELVGIGKVKAEAIVAYRDANGSFTSVDELLEVKGIGTALLDRNRDRLSVN